MRLIQKTECTEKKTFEFSIPHCDDEIAIIDKGSQFIWIISIDTGQGYHQVHIRRIEREKLAFFSPDGSKYPCTVMPFGPTNAPAFYSAMMKSKTNRTLGASSACR